MSGEGKNFVTTNSWRSLRQLTAARIALGRAGISIPTAPHLEFQLAHARARNAVHHVLDVELLKTAAEGLSLKLIELNSAAVSRAEYLQRPDKGRMLSAASRDELIPIVAGQTAACDVAIVIGDGLSAFAVEKNAGALLQVVVPLIRASGWSIAPATVVRNARVAIGDEIAHALGAQALVVLIGERPGLSSPDSLGIYMTYAPRPGLTDESRNCISNVRVEGLSYDEAAHKLMYLMTEAFKRRQSGVLLKDEAETLSVSAPLNRTVPLALK